ncbi:MAG: hypothetical protein LBR23_08410 [Spirochaetaceae bacterium]|jgi:heptaprenyl diphosphate synthase|nr:hypothetical protein [Spirochaetaceae bacterium]
MCLSPLRNTGSEVSFLALIVCLPAFLLQKNTDILAAEAAVFLCAAVLRRGRVRVLPSLGVIVSVTAMGVLTPFGRVIFTLGPLPVTQGALLGGLRRALTLTGMVFLSQAASPPATALPGRAGEFLTGMFSALDALTGDAPPRNAGAGTNTPSLNGFIAAIDGRLLAAEERLRGVSPEKRSAPGIRRNPPLPGILLLAGLAALMYGLLLVR